MKKTRFINESWVKSRLHDNQYKLCHWLLENQDFILSISRLKYSFYLVRRPADLRENSYTANLFEELGSREHQSSSWVKAACINLQNKCKVFPEDFCFDDCRSAVYQKYSPSTVCKGIFVCGCFDTHMHS